MNEGFAAIGRARPIDEPVRVARAGTLVHQTVRVRDGRIDADALCELDAAGIRLNGERINRAIPWRDARSITVDRGRALVVSPIGTHAIMVVLDGVDEPELAPQFARVLEEGRAGTIASPTGARHEFTLGIDRALEQFADADDPIVPIAIGVFTVLVGLVLVAAVPSALQVAARIQPEPGTFVVLPRIAFFDPRVVVAAFAGAAALAVLVGRLALGGAATTWARGTLRGWHRNAYGLEATVRRAIARLMLASRITSAIAAVAILTLVPSAFARTVVDAAGIHEASGFPFLSHDRSWAELTAVVPLAVGFGERLEGFDTALDFSDGARLSTRGRDLVGGSERAFFDFAKAHAR